VDLERGPLSFVRIIEELLERTVAVPIYKTEINGRGNSLRWPLHIFYPLKLALTSPTSGGRSVGIVRWRTKSPEVILSEVYILWSSSLSRNWESSVTIVTQLQAERPKNLISIPERRKNLYLLYSVQTGSGAHLVSYKICFGENVPRSKLPRPWS
jgi:hypothetical protein